MLLVNAHKTCFVVEPAAEQLIYKSMVNFFASAVNSGDLTRFRVEQKENLEKFGLNTELAREYFDAISAVIAALNEGFHSSESVKCDWREIVNRYSNAGLAFIKSQPGLENLPKAENLRRDPRNEEFFQAYDESGAGANYIFLHPAPAITYFNDKTAKAFAHFTKLIAEVSHRGVQAKSFNKR
jgi:hypothetical protein